MARKPEIGATRDSYVYRLRVPADLKEQWDSWCSRTDRKSSDVMRTLMRQIVEDDITAEARRRVFSQAADRPDDAPKERVEVRLTATEHQAIVTKAEAEGCSIQRWIVNCVRAHLTHEPQFTMETTKALWESSYQLRAIGRNLNQIAKRLNEGLPGTIKAEQIEKLSTFIYQHAEKVAEVQDASLSRWGVEIEEDGNA